MNTNEFSFILKTSPIGGIGVFATHDIEPGVKLAVYTEKHKSRLLHENEIPKELLMYCVAKENDMWTCPEDFSRMEVGWHLNHSNTPNSERRGKGLFYSVKEIKAGEEITLDYNTLGEPEDKKEDYYK